MNINSFAVNEKAEIAGIWKDVGGGGDLLVARDGNTAFTSLLRKMMFDARAEAGTSDLGEKRTKKILIEVIARTILLDWKGMTDGTGTVPYSVEKAIEWLTKYKEFLKVVDAISMNFDNYRAEVIKEVQKDIKK